jgi:Flp pilus assembly protein TadD
LRAGNIARDAKNFSEAERNYRQAMKLNPKEARADEGLGNIAFDQRRGRGQ